MKKIMLGSVIFIKLDLEIIYFHVIIDTILLKELKRKEEYDE